MRRGLENSRKETHPQHAITRMYGETLRCFEFCILVE